MDGQAAEAAKDPFFTEDDAPRRELTDADKQRLLPGVITLSLINKELEEVEATLRESQPTVAAARRYP